MTQAEMADIQALRVEVMTAISEFRKETRDEFNLFREEFRASVLQTATAAAIAVEKAATAAAVAVDKASIAAALAVEKVSSVEAQFESHRTQNNAQTSSLQPWKDGARDLFFAALKVLLFAGAALLFGHFFVIRK